MRLLCSMGLHLWRWKSPELGIATGHYGSNMIWMERGTCERCGHEKWRRFPR